jgi:miniconductance mechanosensitive channel
MQESGGRRINRSIFINVRSIKFVEKSDLVRYKKYQILKDFIEQRQNEIDTYNATNNIDISEAINGRHMTNIGVFRRYIELYLMNHPHIRKDMTLLIRQLSIDERGIPINLYCFTATTNGVTMKTYKPIFLITS